MKSVTFLQPKLTSAILRKKLHCSACVTAVATEGCKKKSNKRRHGIKAEEQDNLTSSSAETEPATQLTKSHTCILKCSRNDGGSSIYTFSTHNTFSSLVLLTYIAECIILNRATSILVETSKQDHIKQVVFIFKTSICSQSGQQVTSCTASQKQK